MPKYGVEIAVATFRTTVEAKGEKEAKEKAEEQYIKEGRDEREITIWLKK